MKYKEKNIIWIIINFCYTNNITQHVNYVGRNKKMKIDEK